MFEVKTKSDWMKLASAFVAVVAIVVFCLHISTTNKIAKEKVVTQKQLHTCRQVLASQNSQVAVDLMKLTAQMNDVTKRLKVMASLLQRDAEVIAEVRWFVQYSKRLEQQGMVGCTYRRTRRGKLRKCKPKFNLSDCQKMGGRYICPLPEPLVVKQKRKRRGR